MLSSRLYSGRAGAVCCLMGDVAYHMFVELVVGWLRLVEVGRSRSFVQGLLIVKKSSACMPVDWQCQSSSQADGPCVLVLIVAGVTLTTFVALLGSYDKIPQ